MKNHAYKILDSDHEYIAFSNYLNLTYALIELKLGSLIEELII